MKNENKGSLSQFVKTYSTTNIRVYIFDLETRKADTILKRVGEKTFRAQPELRTFLSVVLERGVELWIYNLAKNKGQRFPRSVPPRTRRTILPI